MLWFKSFIFILWVTSNLEAKPVLWFFLNFWQLLSFLYLFLLFFHLFFLFFFINLLNLLWFQFLLFFLFLHFFVKLLFVFLAINNIFFFYFVLCDKNLLNFFKKLSLNLSHTFFYSAARTSEFFAAFFRKLFSIDSENS